MAVATEKQVELGEYSLKYATAGEGDPMVLLHGGDRGETWRTWELLLPLSNGHRLFLLDLVGFGGSSRPPETPDYRAQAFVLRDFVDRLGVAPAVIVGGGWGGQVALQFALQWPAKTKSLILIASTYDKEQLPLLGKMRRPTLIVWAEDDMVTQLKAGYLLRDAIGSSKLVVLPPVAKDPKFDFTISHKLTSFRANELMALMRRFLSDPTGEIAEPPELENELRGLALRREGSDTKPEGGAPGPLP